MKYAYIRVSTKEQNVERQISELIKYVDVQNIYIDKASGRNFERPAYKLLKEKIVPEDEIYIKELDRLGRNKKEILQQLQYFRDRNIIIRILDIPTTLMEFENFGELQKSIMDLINNILIEFLSMQAENELKKIKQRQKEGIAIAKEKGKYENCGRPKRLVSYENCGRPKRLVSEDKNFIFLYNQYKDNKIKAVDFTKMMNCSRTTLYKKINLYENEKV
ncbi:MAG: recombinase family protein [Peptoanaerobacter stomatis]|uniref:recombinase family protein n=1 Tax=Peptoanaerobacter stomatis TaxID=796937 RepID=UPI003FA100E3